MAILTNTGRVAMAQAIASRPIHMAWGNGNPAWDEDGVPPESLEAAGLTAEVGRRVADRVEYVLPDPNGDIDVPGGRFSVSQTPTNHLYLRFNFAFAEAADQAIREVGVFTDTVTAPDLPPGQEYFNAGDVTDPGTLFQLEHLAAVINRSPAVRQTFEFVVTI